MVLSNQVERHFNWRNFWVTYFLSYGQLAFGFPASIISTTLGSPLFQEYFGLDGPGDEKSVSILIG